MKIRSLKHNRGLTLAIVGIITMLITLIGMYSMRGSIFGSKLANGDRDRSIAQQSAEAAIQEAYKEIMKDDSTNTRKCIFDGVSVSHFETNCGTGKYAGLCLTNSTQTKPLWSTIDFSETGHSSGNHTAEFGQFTNSKMMAGRPGTTAKLPRYIIENVPYTGQGSMNYTSLKSGVEGSDRAYMVTAIGYGLRGETTAMQQALIYYPSSTAQRSGCI
jgi:type IV pilus assembly protein PilX